MSKSNLEYKVLKNFENNPKLTQRQIAKELGLSLGKTNFIIQSLIKRGLVKINNFKRSDNKIGYLYYLTPKGISEKALLAEEFLRLKSEQYKRLKDEIEKLKNEI